MKNNRESLSSPVVKASSSNVVGVGSSPGQRTKIPHASWRKQNIKQKQRFNKFRKDFQLIHMKKHLKKKKKTSNVLE